MTEYIFQINKRVKVAVKGMDTDNNFEKAEKMAIKKISDDIELECLNAEVSEEYEEGVFL